MKNEYASLTELGRHYGTTNQKVGRILKEEGLRNDDGKPSTKAHKEKMVDQRGSTNPATYYYVWHKEKTMKVLDKHLKAIEPAPAPVPTPVPEPGEEHDDD